MKFGIWTNFYGDLGLIDALTRLSRLGIRYVEYSFEHILALEREGSDDIFRSIKEAADSLGVQALQMHGPSLSWTETYNLACRDEAVRRKCVMRTCRWVEFCYKLGVPVLVEHPGSIPVRTTDELRKVKEINVESFKIIAKFAEDRGVKVAVENMFDPKPERLEGMRFLRHPPRYGSTIEEVRRICESTDPEVVGICLDTSHANYQGLDVAEAVKQCGDLLYATHLSDNDGTGDQHLSPMRGSIDWKSVIQALKSIDYDKFLSLEIPGENHPSIAVRDNRLRLVTITMENLLR